MGAEPVTSESVARHKNVDLAAVYLAVLLGGLFMAAVAWKRSFQPFIGVSAAMVLLIWVAWAVRPRLGLNLTIFFALIGDLITVSWFPFNKNLSSEESILWIANGVSISPLELTLLFALPVVAYKRWAQNQRFFERGELMTPVAIVVAMIGFGFIYGISRGGDLRVAMFEMRPLVYFTMVYVLANSVCRHPRHFRHLLFTALGAVTVQSLLSVRYALALPPAYRGGLNTLTEHGSSITTNLLFVALFASLAIRGCSWRLRVVLLVASLPSMWVYLLSQRRVAFVALAISLILFGVILFWRQRRTFWLIVPLVGILSLGYVGAFWNATGPAAFPAQAVKTVVAPDELSFEDQSSDQYRIIENFNLQATIKSSPVLGIGFGQPFLRPVYLPDISVFEFHEYIPHNSVLWLWIKTGVVGFVAFLYIVARSIVSGVERVRRQALGVDLVVSIAGVFFVIMFATFLFADIGWEPRNSVLFGACLALCTSRGDSEGSSSDTTPDKGDALPASSHPEQSYPGPRQPALATD